MAAEIASFSLVGRDAEICVLHEAFHRAIVVDGKDGDDVERTNDKNSRQEFVLIHGGSGSGKTSLANSLQSEVNRYSGFFLTGKFKLTSVQNPYAVVASAFEEFIDELFLRANHDSKSNRLDEMRTVIQDAVGEEGKLITDIIPSLELLIGKQDENCEIHGANSLRRFQYLFCKLCRTISSISPLVFFFDDLQWCDAASLHLLLTLLQDRNTNQLIIGSCREDLDREYHDTTYPPEARQSHVPLFSFANVLESIESTNKVSVTRIRLNNLDQSSIHQLVANYLQQPLENCSKVASNIYSRCNGSPFHALQILKGLSARPSSRESLLRDPNSNELEDDFVSANNCINELIRQKLKDLPELSQRALQVGACLGDEIDENAIAIVLELDLDEIQRATLAAAAKGHLMFDAQRGLHRFSHDQIRQGALSLIDDMDAFSFRIGYSLWKKSSPLFLNTNMFAIANLLNHGTSLLVDQEERYHAAALNWEAGIKASSLANFADSSRYLKAGIDFLKGGDYWADQYDLTLSLFNAAADTEVCTQAFGRTLELVQEVLDHAHTLHDKIQAHVAKINCLCQNGNTQQAIDIGIDVLEQLGETLPRVATKRAIIWEIVMTKFVFIRQSKTDLMSLRPMENKDKLHAMHVLSVLVPYAFLARSVYNPLMATRMVRMCLKHGLHKSAAMGLITYAWAMCSHDGGEGYRLGSMALSMVDRLRAKDISPRVHATFYSYISYWNRPLRESFEPLKFAAAAAMEIGDVECAMGAIYVRLLHMQVSTAITLSEAADEFVEVTYKMRQYKQDTLLRLINLSHQYVHNLTGRAAVPTVLVGEIVKPTLEDDVSDSFAEVVRLSLEANLSYRFGDFERANELLEKERSLKCETFATLNCCMRRQFEALIAIECARLGRETTKQCKVVKQIIKQAKCWAAACPENFLCTLKILEAEFRSLKPHKGIHIRTLSMYNDTIMEATNQGFMQQAALACELSGNYVNRQGDASLAEKYWKQSHSMYMKWGATEKSAHLLKTTGINLSQ